MGASISLNDLFNGTYEIEVTPLELDESKINNDLNVIVYLFFINLSIYHLINKFSSIYKSTDSVINLII